MIITIIMTIFVIITARMAKDKRNVCGDLLTSDFVLRALVAGFLIAVMCGVMGCFVVWRRMAYFGDSLSHSALLGIAIGLATGLTQMGGIILICLLFSGLLLWLSHRDVLTTDSLLGILAHGALSFGMVLLELVQYQSRPACAVIW